MELRFHSFPDGRVEVAMLLGKATEGELLTLPDEFERLLPEDYDFELVGPEWAHQLRPGSGHAWRVSQVSRSLNFWEIQIVPR